MTIGHQQVMPIIFDERLIYYREKSAGAYGAFPYWISGMFLRIPLIIVSVLVYSGILYHLAGFNPSAYRFLYFYYFCCVSSFTGFFMCQLLAAITPTAAAGLNMFPMTIYFAMAFGGYATYIPVMPVWLRVWAPYASFFRWGFQGLALNELQENNALSGSQYYINELGFDTFNRKDCAIIVPIFTIITGLSVFLALKFINFEKR